MSSDQRGQSESVSVFNEIISKRSLSSSRARFLCVFVQQSTQSCVNRRQSVTANTAQVILVRSSCGDAASWNHWNFLVCVSHTVPSGRPGGVQKPPSNQMKWSDALTFFVLVKFGPVQSENTSSEKCRTVYVTHISTWLFALFHMNWFWALPRSRHSLGGAIVRTENISAPLLEVNAWM